MTTIRMVDPVRVTGKTLAPPLGDALTSDPCGYAARDALSLARATDRSLAPAT